MIMLKNLKFKNLNVYCKTDNIHRFYRLANLVVNFTRIDMVIETFGLTILVTSLMEFQ